MFRRQRHHIGVAGRVQTHKGCRVSRQRPFTYRLSTEKIGNHSRIKAEYQKQFKSFFDLSFSMLLVSLASSPSASLNVIRRHATRPRSLSVKGRCERRCRLLMRLESLVRQPKCCRPFFSAGHNKRWAKCMKLCTSVKLVNANCYAKCLAPLTIFLFCTCGCPTLRWNAP